MSILDKIVSYKRDFVTQQKKLVPLAQLRNPSETAPLTRPFRKALKGTRDAEGNREPQSTLRIVAEVKRASPSRGVIRKQPDFSPIKIARSYRDGGAAAVSVLTDEKFFLGSLEYLDLVHQAVSLPVLRKEFIIDPYQVYEARHAGADAVLLIAGMISWGEIKDLAALITEQGMEVLLEVHDEAEIEKALEVRPHVLGINNRDLRTEDLSTDLKTTERLLPLIPSQQVVISESGIRTREDVEFLAKLGVDGVLVGEHLMVEDNPGAAIFNKFGLGKPI